MYLEVQCKLKKQRMKHEIMDDFKLLYNLYVCGTDILFLIPR